VPQVEVTFDIDANGILNVAAKDKATGKEQKVTITASSMLSKDDVDKMVREAAEHASEDAERRRQAETRNEADALVFQADRLVADLGDKLSDEDRTEVTNKTDAVREALKGTDAGAIDSTKQQLTEVLQRVGTKAYETAGPTDGDGGAAGNGSGPSDDVAADAAAEDEGETIEGEYKEV
jgi:molecular chaperone DnaK